MSLFCMGPEIEPKIWPKLCPNKYALNSLESPESESIPNVPKRRCTRPTISGDRTHSAPHLNSASLLTPKHVFLWFLVILKICKYSKQSIKLTLAQYIHEIRRNHRVAGSFAEKRAFCSIEPIVCVCSIYFF